MNSQLTLFENPVKRAKGRSNFYDYTFIWDFSSPKTIGELLEEFEALSKSAQTHVKADLKERIFHTAYMKFEKDWKARHLAMLHLLDRLNQVGSKDFDGKTLREYKNEQA